MTRHPLLTLCAPSGAPPSSLLDGLQAYWKLDEASGTRVDSGPNGLDLTPTNAPGSAAGKVGSAATFVQASAQYLSHADAPALRVNGSWTWSLWVKLSSVDGNNGLLAKIDQDTFAIEYSLGYVGGAQNNFIGFVDDGSNSELFFSETPEPAIVGTWYHILVQFNIATNEIGISVDNSALSLTMWGGTQTAGTGDLWIGQDTWNFDYGDAAIDEAGFWNRLLTTDERTALYNAGDGVTYPFS